MTLKNKLEEIATTCKNSTEFTEQATKYVKDTYGDGNEVMLEAEMRDVYRKVKNQQMIDAGWDKYNDVIYPALRKKKDLHGLWYEVWIDLDETWEDRWMSVFRLMPDSAIIDACAQYLLEREKYYDSPDYYDMLDRMAECVNKQRKQQLS